MSIQLRQTAETMIAQAFATTGGSARGAEEDRRARAERARAREARFFGFRREARLDLGRARVPERRDRAMA